MSEAPVTWLERLERTARFLRPLRHVAFVAAGLFGAAFIAAAAAVPPFSDDTWMIPAMLGVLWCLALFSFIITFQEVPPQVDEQMRGLRRLRARMVRGYYWGLAWALGLLTLTVGWLSFRLLTVWTTDYPT